MRKEDKKEVYGWIRHSLKRNKNSSLFQVNCNYHYIKGALDWMFDHNDFSNDDMKLKDKIRFGRYARVLTLGGVE